MALPSEQQSDMRRTQFLIANPASATDWQERAAERFQKSHNYPAMHFLSDHCLIASAAFELSNKMSSMPLDVYLAFARVLDRAQGWFPTAFCIKALMHAARARQVAGTESADVINMFALTAPQGTNQNRFEAFAPRLQNIMPLSCADIEIALADGLFGTVMLRLMTLHDGVCAATAAAATLRDACSSAHSMALAALGSAPGPSVMAGPRVVCLSWPLPAEWAWIHDLQDVAGAILYVATDDNSQDGFDKLQRVQEATSGSRKLLADKLKMDPWLTLSGCAGKSRKYVNANHIINAKIQEALQVCASDPEAWLEAAAQIPVWKAHVEPGATTELEEMLWKVLLAAWDNFDAEDLPGSTALVNRLRLARRLMAPNRPDADCIDLMELVAPRPQVELRAEDAAMIPPTLDHAMWWLPQVAADERRRQ